MPDFIRLTGAYTGRPIVVATSMIGAVRVVEKPSKQRPDGIIDVLVQGVWISVKESEAYVLTLMGVPRNRTVIDNRDRPIHELTDEELTVAWRQWNERKNLVSWPVIVMIELELKRRAVVVGEERE